VGRRSSARRTVAAAPSTLACGDAGRLPSSCAVTIPASASASAPALNGHLAVPSERDGPWPGVVVLHEGLGLADDVRRHTDRFASSGFLAVAPDLYTAGGAPRCMLATFRTLMRRRGATFDDIDAVRRWLVARDDCTGRVGVAGFCMGGGFALLAATRGFDAAAPNYPAGTNGIAPEDMRDACPIVASYGGADWMTRGAAARLRSALEAQGVEHDIHEYPRARHSFLSHHDRGPQAALVRLAGFGHDDAAAQDTWRRILAFFDRHLAAPDNAAPT
jgi:carboxymethylenebutenolidase